MTQLIRHTLTDIEVCNRLDTNVEKIEYLTSFMGNIKYLSNKADLLVIELPIISSLYLTYMNELANFLKIVTLTGDTFTVLKNCLEKTKYFKKLIKNVSNPRYICDMIFEVFNIEFELHITKDRADFISNDFINLEVLDYILSVTNVPVFLKAGERCENIRSY